MNRRAFLAGVVGATSVTLAGCSSVLNMGSESRSMGGDFDIGTSSMDFHPEKFTATVGDTVVWKNTGMRQHTVTAYENLIPDDAEYFASGGFDSEQAARDGWNNGKGGILQGRTYEHTFEVPGKYPYLCIPHESRGMVGTIVVKEK
ncbi:MULTISPECIES: plastocyanin/azurin family copper-binding protein [unclassified Haladaptatus]|uniref:plastocyanin/azurin family copper-binding protein n=1 Tax=unclassified Haladaptatus TaxID=2622732 RepID=UPI00209BBE28|nr:MULTISPECIES: plastocyanin/azurin family copper-binding protein [unclassified Haladaptatus]MCO8243890.1 plastocyanin/azurin family copper-binding protein [Haladaptatus sp. AB643]MCO8256425.1 plastocyanin/azurin family copper-binding protein [Haladaptatus sp. AB618]